MTPVLPRMRLRTDPDSFAAWRAGLPTAVLPPWFDQDGTPSSAWPPAPAVLGRHRAGGDGAASVIPPHVAAALALHTDPALSLLLRVDDAGRRVVGCVAVSAGLASCLVRAVHRPQQEPADEGSADAPPRAALGWTEIALVPLEAAVEEVLRWVPSRPREPGAVVEVLLLRRQDAAAHWARRWIGGPDGWQRTDQGPAGSALGDSALGGSAPGGSALAGSGGPGAFGLAELVEDLRFLLTSCLCDPTPADPMPAGATP